MSLAAEDSTMANTSVATPPKKRKISDVSDLPFEVNKITLTCITNKKNSRKKKKKKMKRRKKR
jgi:hypothetical protein